MLFSPLPTPRAHDLDSIARAAGEALAAIAGGALLRVHDVGHAHLALSWHPLDGRHPLEALTGFVAPPDWRAIGVSTSGLAHTPQGSDRVRVTMLADRAGATASLLHRDEGDQVLTGRTEGEVADACRRALGLPTSPPPGSSLALWTIVWLDRVVVASSDREPGHPELAWPAVARLHPASTGPADAISLALASLALAEAWPWGRLRAEPAMPDLAEVVGPLPPPQVAAWMDDGMWARWVVERLPSIDDLLGATRARLAPAVADAVELVVAVGGDRARDERTWPDAAPGAPS